MATLSAMSGLFVAPETATASRSTSGTGYWPTTPTTTAAASSWIGMFRP